MSKNILSHLQINRDIPIPLYYQLKTNIIEMINSEILKVGDMLPTENEITEYLNISRPTVRQALTSLAEDGYLIRNRGIGTFISKPKFTDYFFSKLESFNEELINRGNVPRTEVKNLRKIDGIDEINSALGISRKDSLLHLERLRFSDETPIVYLDTYLSYKKYKNLQTEDLVNNSLYDLLSRKYHIDVYHAKREIEAVPARADEANYLNIELNQPICLVKSIVYTESEIPVEYSIARYRGDKTKFYVELFRT